MRSATNSPRVQPGMASRCRNTYEACSLQPLLGLGRKTSWPVRAHAWKRPGYGFLPNRFWLRVTPTVGSRIAVGDASAVVALLLDSGPNGRWATENLSGRELVAPALMPFEAANVIRRHELAASIGVDQAAQAHADLLDLSVVLWPHEVLAQRAWELRKNLSIYDATYVALAELVDCALVTLDARIARAPGVRCRVVHP
jgi:predicted nucleic acid-binding protein